MIKLLPLLIGVIVCLGCFALGAHTQTLRYELQLSQEREKRLLENQEAIEKARETERQLKEQLRSRNETIRMLSIESSLSANASDICIDPDGVRRLNSIR